MSPRILTDEEEAQIAAIYASGISARAIARVYGLSSHTFVAAALKRQRIQQRSPAERNRLYALNPYVFDNVDSEQAAYWWGFIYADGCVHKRSLIVIIKWDDRDHLARLREFMQSESPIKEIIANNPASFSPCHNAKIEFTDEHLASRLIELGILAGRTHPDRARNNMPHQSMRHWLRGFFDGDGSARKNPNGGLGFCGSQELMLWIRKILSENVGTSPNIALSTVKHADIRYIRYSGRLQALKVADYMYNGATVWLDRKRSVIDSWPQKRGRLRLKRDEKGRFTPTLLD